ncbi:hypothetical protein C7477_11054 [Phyllobacterium leguminum]|uniref:Uncharacterized protein n=1 Tax=Phyllobacterium leguminum TaxID=314237 RepID=A0A318T1W5_9HYPH|nr:hypothetical protein C7477_11054 [Phyllobacterium leguminum]
MVAGTGPMSTTRQERLRLLIRALRERNDWSFLRRDLP